MILSRSNATLGPLRSARSALASSQALVKLQSVRENGPIELVHHGGHPWLPGVGNMRISFSRDPAKERLPFLSLRRLDRQRVPASGLLPSLKEENTH